MPRGPSVRAVHTRALLAEVLRLPPGERDGVLARLRPGSRQQIEAALVVSWLPLEMHMELSNVVRAELGPARNVDIWRRTMQTGFDRPILRSFVKMALGLFGADPLSLLRQAERIYSQLTHELGTLSFEPSRSTITEGFVSLRGFPGAGDDLACFVEGLLGCLQCALQLAGGSGSVVVDSVDACGDALYHAYS